jgi:hypothetical protein
MIQYAAPSRFGRGRRGLSDAPHSWGMTKEKKKAGSDPGLFSVVIARSESDEAIQLPLIRP